MCRRCAGVDQIYLRANQDRAHGLAMFDRKNMTEPWDSAEDVKTQKSMGLREFVCGNMRLAHAKYAHASTSLYQQWQSLLTINIKPLAKVGDVHDEICEFLESHLGRDWAIEWDSTFEFLFARFCLSAEERRVSSKQQAGCTESRTMSLPEFVLCLKELDLLGSHLTIKECRQIFVQVNLDDDLFVQEDAVCSAHRPAVRGLISAVRTEHVCVG